MRNIYRLLLFLLVGLLAPGCPDSETNVGITNGDTAVDTVADVAPADVALDVALDTQPDLIGEVAPDVTTDTAADMVADAVPDVAPDMIGDTATDVGADTGADLVLDAVPDTVVDIVPDAAVDVAPDAVADAAPDAVADAGFDIGTDAAADVVSESAFVGVVSVGDIDGEGLLAGTFVAASELGLLGPSREPITNAPGCYDLLPPPPAVANPFPAGTLTFTGLILADYALEPGVGGDYNFTYAALMDSPGDPVGVSYPGGAIIDPNSASVAAPDFTPAGSWYLGSTGTFTNWTAGNGDFVEIEFMTTMGPRLCVAPDTGSFIVPAAALDGDGAPVGGTFTYRRVNETVVVSTSGTQELRFRAFKQGKLSLN